MENRTTIRLLISKERDEAFEIEEATPGMQKNDFKITLDRNLLTISSFKEERRRKMT